MPSINPGQSDLSRFGAMQTPSYVNPDVGVATAAGPLASGGGGGGGGGDEGTAGPDTFTGTSGDDRFDGLDGADLLQGQDGDDRLNGDGGADTIQGGLGDDRLDGGDGNDSVDGGAGSDRLDGGLGDDVIASDNSGAVDRAKVKIDAGAGNDTITAVGADTTRIEVRAGLGDDVITVEGGERVKILTGSGADTVNVEGVSGELRLKLGAGVQTINIGADTAFTDRGRIDNFAKGDGGDVLNLQSYFEGALTGWDGTTNPFDGGFAQLLQSGDKTLLQVDADGGGDAFTTVLFFNDADATLFSAANFNGWAPVLGEGTVFVGDDGDDDEVGGEGDDDLGGGKGRDHLEGEDGDDSLHGGRGDDTTGGGLGDDDVDGDEGDDHVSGGDGDDDVDGGTGDDDVDGGEGDDTVHGGGGADTLHGGGGADDFVFSVADGSTVVVDDFEPGKDVFDLTAIDADTATTGDQAFSFVGAFTNAAGQAVLSYDAGADLTTAQFDVNGDGVSDLTLEITGEVTAADGWLL